MAVTGSKSVINYGENATIKYEGRESKEYRVGEGNPQKNKKSVSMKALKQEEPTIPHKDSE